MRNASTTCCAVHLNCRMRCYVEVENTPAVMGQDDEAEEKPEGGGGDDEEIAGGGVAEVISKKGAPGL